MSPTSIDLFAGCGGLSLGLELAGFDTIFVNELHPNAMDTFVMNRAGTAVSEPVNQSFDILELSQNPAELDALARRLKRKHGDIDLVTGGPPCQGFSGIGHRRSFELTKTEIPSNHLYREMAKFVTAIGPKAFVFENVRGLLNSRWTPDGEKGEIWEDVQTAFRSVHVKRGRKTLEYLIGSQLVFAKDYGVPQNRPRIVMVGIRSDLAPMLNLSAVGGGLLPSPSGSAPDLIDLLGDLVDPKWLPGGATAVYGSNPRTEIQMALRQLPGGLVLGKGDLLTEQEYSKHRPEVTEKFRYMIANGGEIPESMQTKKFAQRVLPVRWGPNGPSITATSLPDDYVHFSQPRTPTVREWARLQTFPDWYRFAGRRTTGGRRRAGDPGTGDWSRDLPKYTQIGNAVPVGLGRAIGEHLRSVLGV
jgi:DNA (cytosine-5)-methyltransferase 1